MKASLVIPTYNSRELLAPCLISLNHQRLDPSDEFEVVLVDDGSTDGTGDMVSALPLKYPVRRFYLPRTEESCRSAARNVGIQAAEGELIVFADGDQIIDPLYLREHIRCHRDRPGIVAVGFRDYLAPGPVDLERLRSSFDPEAFPSPPRRTSGRRSLTCSRRTWPIWRPAGISSMAAMSPCARNTCWPSARST